jgi:hypothetical protein
MKAGDIINTTSGGQWRVVCLNDDGSVAGLEPLGFWHRLYWRLRFQ